MSDTPIVCPTCGGCGVVDESTIDALASKEERIMELQSIRDERIDLKTRELERLKSRFAKKEEDMIRDYVRSQIGRYRDNEKHRKQLSEKDAEIARMKDENKLMRGSISSQNERLLQAARDAGILFVGCDTPGELAITVQELRAENQRLREALHKIAWEPIGDAEATDSEIYRDILDIAKQALASTAQEQEKSN